MKDRGERLFCGVFPTGIGWADRLVEVGGDYKRLAFLTFSTLDLDIEKGCPADLRAIIESQAADLQARAGESYEVSRSGQTITLGWALPAEAGLTP